MRRRLVKSAFRNDLLDLWTEGQRGREQSAESAHVLDDFDKFWESRLEEVRPPRQHLVEAFGTFGSVVAATFQS